MTVTPSFPASFLLLQQEGHLISSCLTTGLTELRSAHVHNKGAFYSALFNLSIGFERLLKAVVIIDHMLKNRLTVPTRKQLKHYGHDIRQLYDSCAVIPYEDGQKLPQFDDLPPIAKEIVILLSDFGQTTRYHNLDALSASTTGQDPLIHFNRILELILQRDVHVGTKARLARTASEISEAHSDNTLTIMQGLDKKALSTYQALSLPGLHEQAVKHAVLYVVRLLSPVRDLIEDLSRRTHGVPQMQEFLEWLFDDRQYVLRKRKWP
ncbi:hypothetical protein LJR022_000140 [Paraburkholderia hospita]|uniref:hypothetical protein n=1 Tax=Paraburkholderia hospita TaxID=169430 RepID=UPI003ECD3DB8